MARRPSAGVGFALRCVVGGALALSVAAGAAQALPPAAGFQKPGLFNGALAELGGARVYFAWKQNTDPAMPFADHARFLAPTAKPDDVSLPPKERYQRFQGTLDWSFVRVGERLIHMRAPGAKNTFWLLNFTTGWAFQLESAGYGDPQAAGASAKLPFRCQLIKEGVPAAIPLTAGIQCPTRGPSCPGPGAK